MIRKSDNANRLIKRDSSSFSPKFFETDSSFGNFQRVIHIITLIIEALLSIVLVVGIVLSAIHVPEIFREIFSLGLPGVRALIDYVSLIIIIIELIHVLNLQNLKSVIEILMIAFTRELVIKEWDMLELLIGVVCIAALFAIDKFLIDGGKEKTDGSDKG